MNTEAYDLSVKNPNAPAGPTIREPKKILEEIKQLDKEGNTILENLKQSL